MSNYRADIDGLRAVAVLAVLVFHAFPEWLPGGFVGVDVFFVISGFLISSIILKRLDRNSFSLREFYRRRAARILPALTVVLVATLAAGWFILPAQEYAQLAMQALGGAAFVSNLLLWHQSGYFDADSVTKPLLHLWSLAIEEQFYMVWPLLLPLVHRRTKAVGVALALLLLWVASFAVNLASFPAYPVAAFYSPLARFWELASGGLLAWIALRQPSALSRCAGAQAAAGTALLVAGMVLAGDAVQYPGAWALLPVVGTMLLLSAGTQAWINRSVLSHPLAVWVGRISYPLYLWHWPLLSFALILNSFIEPTRGVRVGLLSAAVALSWLTFKLVEAPVRWRRLLSTPQLAAALGAVAALSVAIVLFGGMPARAVNRDEGAVFIESYARLNNIGFGLNHLDACDFYDWRDGSAKDAIATSCTALTGKRPAVLLWGDSHAQALSVGIRQVLAPFADFALVATSACNPQLNTDPANGANKLACRRSNELAVEVIRTRHPGLVVVAQRGDHEATDWAAMARFVKENGGELVLLGPMPQWRPSLPAIVAAALPAKPHYVSRGLDPKIVATNEKLREAYGAGPVHYVSLMDRLCRPDGCQAWVDSAEPLNLLVADYGHATPVGSRYVAESILEPVLAAVSKRTPPRP